MLYERIKSLIPCGLFERGKKLLPQALRLRIKAALGFREFIPAPASGPDNAAGPAPLVSIVIPVYNNLAYTQGCLRSILAQPAGVSLEVIVVDNNSSDGTREWMTGAIADEPRLRYVRSEVNLGFAGGVNLGAAKARGQLLAIANNDLIMTDDWLAPLVRLIQSADDIGLVSPSTNYIGEGPQLLEEFADIGPDDAPQAARTLRARNLPEVEVPDRLVFFCVLMRRGLWDLLGGLSSDFGLGNFEDDDLCLRARMVGYRLLISRQSFVFHYGSRTFKEQKISHALLMAHNRQVFLTRMARMATGLPRHAAPAAAATPLFSVVVRTVNRPALLAEALMSLRNQIEQNFEVIVVNDGGPDIAHVLAPFQQALRLRYIHHDQSRGCSAALNTGARAAAGRWVCYLDDDDIVYPNHLAVFADAIRRHPDRAVFHADFNIAAYLSQGACQRLLYRVVQPPFEFDRDHLMVENRISIMTFVHRRDCLEKVGCFDETLDVYEDWDFLLRLARQFPFQRIGRYTSEYRMRAGCDMNNATVGKRLHMHEMLLSIYQRHPADNPQITSRRNALARALRNQVDAFARIQSSPADPLRKSLESLMLITGVPSGGAEAILKNC